MKFISEIIQSFVKKKEKMKVKGLEEYNYLVVI